jgi:hypothetical protein
MLKLASGTYDQVLLVLSALADHYGWRGQVGTIMAEMVLDREKAERLLADALSALPGDGPVTVRRGKITTTETYH